MKKVLLSLAVVALGYTAQAQEKVYGFQEGDVLVEGSIGLSSEVDKNTDEKTSSFAFNPKAGLMLSDKFAVGVEVFLSNEKSTLAGKEVGKTNAAGAGVFGRYYFLDLGQRFKTYAEAGVAFGSGKATLAGVEGPKTNITAAGLGLGFNYFITPKVAINFGLSDILSYNSSKVEGGKAVSQTQVNLNVFDNFFSTATFGLTFKL